MAQAILEKMFERLVSGLMTGPAMNCRPHSSRQRLDLTRVAAFGGVSVTQILAELMGSQRKLQLISRVAVPKRRSKSTSKSPLEDLDETLSPQERTELKAWREQQAIIAKLLTIAEDTRTYENDTGVNVLHIGFPLLSMPPGSVPGSPSRRICAPIAFLPVAMTLREGTTPSLQLEIRGDRTDGLMANIGLMAWLEQQSGQFPDESPGDEDELTAWETIARLVRRICPLLNLPIPEFKGDVLWQPAPRSEDEGAGPAILSSAVIGLFPQANQGLLRDTRELLAQSALGGPLRLFLESRLNLDAPAADRPHLTGAPAATEEADRLVSIADPCQRRAVSQARSAAGLVIHGPPGTGKSQTITNIIGDYLARGARVLMVCDKRTALDVVYHRLESLGLGDLVAVVHDPQHDQKRLYKEIREQLEQLPELKTDGYAEAKVTQIDGELRKLHAELTRIYQQLMTPPDRDPQSLHQLMGEWFSLPVSDLVLDKALLRTLGPDQVLGHQQEIIEILDRGIQSQWRKNPWARACGQSLGDFLSQPMDSIRESIQQCVAAGDSADAAADPRVAPFNPASDFKTQAEDRVGLAADILALRESLDARIRRFWLEAKPEVLRAARRKIQEAGDAVVSALAAGSIGSMASMDRELLAIARPLALTLPWIQSSFGAMNYYLDMAPRWYGFLAFKAKSDARKVLGTFGLALTAENARRLRGFLELLRPRILLHQLNAELRDEAPSAALASDDLLETLFSGQKRLILLRLKLSENASLKSLGPQVFAALSGDDSEDFLEGLGKSWPRAQALEHLAQVMKESGLFHQPWREEFLQTLTQGNTARERLSELAGYQDSLEGVIRIRDGLSRLPPPLGLALQELLREGVAGDAGLVVLRRAALSYAITERLRSSSELQSTDSHRLEKALTRYAELESQKRAQVGRVITHLWGQRQQSRLLAATGSRLNTMGAEVRRRLFLRGQHAMRLRQVIHLGQAIPDGDPLLDLRPVWMASPETVAEIFPRQEFFDVVIFDEASQCRLEEALPVLTRARRVVIAGDPKQLPPTRFFESTQTASADDDEITSDQDLFEHQQGEIEDLLGASLNIEIQEAYLDVHYRSRNADLIEFSNRNFYDSRLQPIPGHPANIPRYSPLTLYQVDGVYAEHSNRAEADQVVKIVADLLRRAEPPSIGIACFNIQQRDLIIERLNAMAGMDRSFASQLAEARERRGAGSFEGLFVKNLENVQGDERDHLVISTTYGPTPEGKFHRRFGPLGQAGGGRRLNVLVTRARQEVHLITSIPQAVYQSLPPIPAGEIPGGGWLLMSYLAYARNLSGLYQRYHQRLEEQKDLPKHCEVQVHPTSRPSSFAAALAEQLAGKHHVGSEVFWGNDGFCVDLALGHPERFGDVTLGILCDLNRFGSAYDPIEWELFRTGMLKAQGWQLQRLWTPHFFRDPSGCMAALVRQHEQLAAKGC